MPTSKQTQIRLETDFEFNSFQTPPTLSFFDESTGDILGQITLNEDKDFVIYSETTKPDTQ